MHLLPPEKVKKCLSRMSWKLSRTVLRRGKGSNPFFLVDYTNKVFQTKLKNHGIEQSMSRVGCCIDNCPTEGFWGIIKSEMYYISKFQDIEELRQAILEFIDYYNNGRYQERFNNLAPMEVRLDALTSDNPKQYPIPENKRILAYKARLEEKKQKQSA